MSQDTGVRPALYTSTTPGPTDVVGAPLPDEGLARTVRLALRALADRSMPRTDATGDRLAELLHSAVGGLSLRLPGQDTPAVGQAAVAVRVACAYLTAGDFSEAELALITAEDLLGGRGPGAGGLDPGSSGGRR